MRAQILSSGTTLQSKTKCVSDMGAHIPLTCFGTLGTAIKVKGTHIKDKHRAEIKRPRQGVISSRESLSTRKVRDVTIPLQLAQIESKNHSQRLQR